MPSKKLKSEKGITIKVHPTFRSDILDRMEREVEKKLGISHNKPLLDDVQKTKILTRTINKQGMKFFMTDEEKNEIKKKKGSDSFEV